MTTNILGPGHYPNTGETNTRPTPVATALNFLAWFAQCDVNGEGGTNIDEQWLNLMLAALRSPILSSGAAQNESSDDMVSEAMARYASGAIWAADSGSADAYVLSSPGNFVMPKAYFQGMRIIWRPAQTNTGTAVANAFTLGNKAIRRPDGGPLAGGELSSLRDCDMRFDVSADAFLLFPWSIAVDSGDLPFFPEILTNGGVPQFSSSTGQVVVSAGQTWLHRLMRKYSSDQFSLGNRTFSLSANKTYHVVWYPPGHALAPVGTWPAGRFMARDLADTSGYNPGSLAEAHTSFDTNFDAMVMARVVTNGGNVPTVTALANKAFLSTVATAYFDEFNLGYSEDTAPENVSTGTLVTLNWSRISRPKLVGITDLNFQYTGSATAENNFGVNPVSRYAMSLYAERTNNPDGRYCRAIAEA